MRPLVYESIFVSRVLIVQQSVLFRRHDRIPERNRVSRVPFRLVFGVDGDEDLFSVPREERSQVESHFEEQRRLVVLFSRRWCFLPVRGVRGHWTEFFDRFYAQKHVRFRDVPNVRDGREDGDERQRGGRQGEQRVRANPHGVTHDVDDSIICDAFLLPIKCGFFLVVRRKKSLSS